MIPSLLLLVVLAGTAPAPPAAWSTPTALGLELSTPRARAEQILARRGFQTEDGKEDNHLVVHIEEKKTATLVFEAGRLQSIRFELVDFIPEIQAAFREQEEALLRDRGKPTRRIDLLPALFYEERQPHVIVVASTAAHTAFGKQGLGFLAVRYFIPEEKK